MQKFVDLEVDSSNLKSFEYNMVHEFDVLGVGPHRRCSPIHPVCKISHPQYPTRSQMHHCNAGSSLLA